MPSLEEIVRQLAEQASATAAEDTGAEPEDVWATWLNPDWPPFTPQPWPRSGANLDWLWHVLWGGPPEPIDPAEALRQAEQEARDFPESHGPRYRRSNPSWLDELIELSEQHASARRFVQVRDLLMANATGGGWSETDRVRISWLKQHQSRIWPLLEAAQTEYAERYG
jgi:hypothetical protein